MSISLFKAARTVLLISDQALYIYSAMAKGTDLIETVPWDAQNFEQNVAQIISKECGNNPILILNDMVEQHYRKEKVPKVGMLDKANVVDRKLLVTFPSYAIRAALPLKEKVKKSDKKTAGDLYIFAAVPSSEPFLKTLGAARQSTASIAGFCLLPVESADLTKKLSDKIFPKEKAKWTILIGHHQSGGLRQIVTRNGELALTRMTPISDGGDEPESWVSEVHQEFKATMSYLTRFGYDQSDGLNVILLAQPALGESFEGTLDTPCNFKWITTSDAADNVGLKLRDVEDNFFADELHAAWAGTKPTLSLPMKIKDLESVSKPRQFVTLFSLLLFLGLAFLVYSFFGSFQTLQSNIGEIDTAVKQKAEFDIQYQKEVKRKEELGFDIQLIQSSLSVKGDLDNNDIDILDLVYNIGQSLGREMRIDKLSVERKPLQEKDENKNNNKDNANSDQKLKTRTLYEAKLTLSFSSTTDAEKGNEIVENLKTEIQKSMPEDVVKISKLLEDYQYSEGLVVQTGNVDEGSAKQDYTAEITIEKKIE